MKLGVLLPTFCTGEHAVDPATVRGWARRADEAGFAALWAIEHLVEPGTYRTSWLDPFVSLGQAAAVTDDIALGTSVLALPQRRTAKVAQGLASLAYLADDRRLSVGVGTGYAEKEFEAVGVPYDERGPRLTEGLDALRHLLSGEASYDGEFHSFESVRIDPVPERQPTYLAAGDSAMVGGERRMTRQVLDRIVDTGGWIAAPEQPEGATAERALVAEHARTRGADPDDVRSVLLNYVHLPDPDVDDVRTAQRNVFERFVDPRGGRGLDYVDDHYLLGTREEVRDQLRAYEAAGFDQVVLAPPGSDAYDASDYEAQLERIAGSLLPAFESGR
jgi:alkanesulfonate monooxygenase SsuD/methylene tetrahydromethanopterin reductase-like flavin-dependent oxidoreductase (luciferase family)